MNETPISIKDLTFNVRMKGRLDETKLLLSKTKREAVYKENITDCKININYKNISDSKNLLNEKIKANPTYFAEHSRKAIKMEKNREAAKKSRNNKKLQYDNMKDKEDSLISENIKMKEELDNINFNLNKICSACRKLVHDGILQIRPKNSCDKKKKFQIFQKSPLSELNNTTSISSGTSVYKMLTGILVIVCLIGNFFYGNNLILNSNQEDKKLGRMLKSIDDSEIIIGDNPQSKNMFQPSEIPSKIKTIEDNMSALQINNKTGLYIQFLDYLKIQTGFSPIIEPSDNFNNDNYQSINKNGTKRKKTNNFLDYFSTANGQSESNIIKSDNDSTNNMIPRNIPINNNSNISTNDTRKVCINNITFGGYSQKDSFGQNEDYTIRFNPPQIKNSETNLKKNKDLNLLKNCFDCYTKNDYMTFVHEKMEKVTKLDSIFFKMVVPINFEEHFKNKEISNIVDYYIEGVNESQIIEKNSKKLYYEIECMILDVNKRNK